MTNTDHTTLVPYLFGETTIRTATMDDVPLVCGKDACDALGIANSRDALSSIPDDEKMHVGNADGNPRDGTPHQLTYLTEPGLYRLIFKSRKAEAKAFQTWVFHDVLPTIRRHGSYGPRSRELLGLARELLGLGFAPRDVMRLVLAAMPPLGVRERNQLAAAACATVPDGCWDDDLLLLARMAGGIWQSPAELGAHLPLGRLAGGNPRSRETVAGCSLNRLLRAGLVERDMTNSRHARYRPAAAAAAPDASKVVSIR